MCLFDTLSNEVILEILHNVQETCPSSMFSISCVSRQLYLLAQSLKYSSVQFIFSKEAIRRATRLLKYICAKPGMRESVRGIAIFSFPSDLPYIQEEARIWWDAFVNLIPSLKRLKDVQYTVCPSIALKGLKVAESCAEYEFGMLPRLLRALHQNHPHCRLSVGWPSRMDLITALSQLENSSCLNSLILTIHPGQPLACAEIFRILPSCPNLRTLNISCWDYYGPDDEVLHLQHPSMGNANAQLVNLKLDGAIFSPGKDEYNHAKHETSPFEFLDPRFLNRLSLTHAEHLISLPSSSMKLRYLSFDPEVSCWPTHSHRIKAQLFSIFTNQKLEELFLTGCMDALTIDSMKPLKDTLKCLKIHENEDENGVCRRRVFSIQEIENLGEALPKLEYLSLDVNYNGLWPYATLAMIVLSFPSLIHQEVNLEINISNPTQPLSPTATLKTSLDIWEHQWRLISAMRVHFPELVPLPRLRSLDINAGSFRNMHGKCLQNMTAWEKYELREQQTFRVRRHDNAAKAERGIARVTCAQVEDLDRKIGTGNLMKSEQLQLLADADVKSRQAISGVSDRKLIRTGFAGPDADNNFSQHMRDYCVLAPYHKEGDWLVILSDGLTKEFSRPN